MCIGIPMQVLAVEPGFAHVEGRGETRRVSTLLVGDCVAGQWLLVFLNDAREVIDAGGVTVEDLVAADLTGDGNPDIVAVGRATHNVKLYVNTLPPRVGR